MIVGAVKVPHRRKGSLVMRALGYALASIAFACTQQSRGLHNSNYEQVDGLCTAAYANRAILGEDSASVPLREMAGLEVRSKEIVELRVIRSFGTAGSGSIDFPKAAVKSACLHLLTSLTFQSAPERNNVNGGGQLNLVLSANQLKVEHALPRTISTSARRFTHSCGGANC
ncbi:MAG: hypothetical protein WB679_06675 [Terracidiphilus sp.]